MPTESSQCAGPALVKRSEQPDAGTAAKLRYERWPSWCAIAADPLQSESAEVEAVASASSWWASRRAACSEPGW